MMQMQMQNQNQEVAHPVRTDLSPFEQGPWKIIYLDFCNIRFYGEGYVRTVFEDGSHFGGYPHDTPHYTEIARRCGYVGFATARTVYCWEHDFCHSFLAMRIKRNVSTVLWPMAHNAPVPKYEGLGEEALVQIFQRWLHTDERPILDVANWDSLKIEALDLLGK